MDWRRDEAVSQGIHQGNWRQPGYVSVVPSINTRGHGGASLGLYADNLELGLLPFDLVLDEGQEQPGEIGAPSDTTHDHVRVNIDFLELLFSFLSYDSLVHQDVVQHAPQRILGVLAGKGLLTSFADSDAQASRAIGVIFEDFSPYLSFLAGAGHYLGSPCLHHHPAIRLLVVACLNHIDLALKTRSEEHTSELQ